jgi:hypothetical protein
MRRRGQVELIALIGVALLILGVIAYFVFFRPPPKVAPPELSMRPVRNAVCPMESAEFKLTVTNPKENPEIKAILNATVKPEGTAWFDSGNGVAVSTVKLDLKPGQSATVTVYGLGGEQGEHVINVTVAYGYGNKVVGVEHVNMPFLVTLCG